MSVIVTDRLETEKEEIKKMRRSAREESIPARGNSNAISFHGHACLCYLPP